MPQTREHAAVLRALGIEDGVVAVTKTDIADPGRAGLEAAELLPGSPAVVPVSARTGDGLDRLLGALERASALTRGHADTEHAAPRLHVDRVFTIRGAGTVVTGTLWSGTVGRGDWVELLPHRRRARVRGVQVHDRTVERAPAGQRVAVNLAGVGVDEVARGDVLSSVGSGLTATYRIDASLAFGEAEPAHGDRVQVHHGTRESPARAAWLGGRFWQLRLVQPLVAAPGDRLVVRQIAPPDTLGGGVVLDAVPRRHGPGREVLARLERLARGERFEEAEEPPPTPPSAPDPGPLPDGALALERQLRDAGPEPPPDSELDPDALRALREAGRAVRVSQTLHYHPEVLAALRTRVIALANEHGGTVTLAQLRDELGTSRKFARALLEHFDSEKLTVRRGDTHRLRWRRRDALPDGD
jgi:selenocysteine-specific elongation factor